MQSLSYSDQITGEQRYVVRMFTGRGRRARFTPDRREGGWVFRLFMEWFGRGQDKRHG